MVTSLLDIHFNAQDWQSCIRSWKGLEKHRWWMSSWQKRLALGSSTSFNDLAPSWCFRGLSLSVSPIKGAAPISLLWERPSKAALLVTREIGAAGKENQPLTQPHEAKTRMQDLAKRKSLQESTFPGKVRIRALDKIMKLVVKFSPHSASFVAPVTEVLWSLIARN